MQADPSQQIDVPDLEVVRPLGHGQIADVFLAREPELKRLVALKVLRSAVAMDETARLNFEREAHAVAALVHPGIVQVHRAGETTDGRPFLLMQYVKGAERRGAARGRAPALDRRSAADPRRGGRSARGSAPPRHRALDGGGTDNVTIIVGRAAQVTP